MQQFDKLLAHPYYHYALAAMPLVGKYGMPRIIPVHANVGGELISFSQAITLHNKEICLADKWFHFYLPDQQLMRLARHPEKYMPIKKMCWWL